LFGEYIAHCFYSCILSFVLCLHVFKLAVLLVLKVVLCQVLY